MPELQDYIPYPTYKFLGNAGPFKQEGNNYGRWENLNRYGLMGLGEYVDAQSQLPQNPWPAVMNPIYDSALVGRGNSNFNLAVGVGAPYSNQYADTGNGAIASPYCSDPGFITGLMSWFDSATIAAFWSNNLADVTSIPTWLCSPGMNLGIVSLPVAVGMLLMVGLGRGSKRRR